MIGFFKKLLGIEQRRRRYPARVPFMLPSIYPGVYTELTVPIVFATIKMLAEDIARLPLHVYEKRTDGSSVRVLGHPLDTILNVQSSTQITGFDMRKSAQSNLVGWGNGYIRVRRNRMGEVYDLITIPHQQVQVHWNPKRKVIDGYTIGSTDIQYVPARQIVHLKGPTIDGITGISAVQQMRQSISIQKHAEKYAEAYIQNHARPSGMLQMREQKTGRALSRESVSELRELWVEQYHGWQNAGSPVVVPPEAEYKETTLPKEDVQLINTRKYQVLEWLAILRIPPHLAQQLDKATYSNIETQSLEYVKYTLIPYLHIWESALNAFVLTEQEREQNLYLKHNVDELLRGEAKARLEALEISVRSGMMSINEARAKQELPPIEGGDVYHIAANLVPLGYHDKKEQDDPIAPIQNALRHKSLLDTRLQCIVYEILGNTSVDKRRLTRYMQNIIGSVDLNVYPEGYESRRLYYAVMRRALQLAGVQQIQWKRDPRCKSQACTTLSDQVVDIDTGFRSKLTHPPADEQCTCSIIRYGGDDVSKNN